MAQRNRISFFNFHFALTGRGSLILYLLFLFLFVTQVHANDETVSRAENASSAAAQRLRCEDLFRSGQITRLSENYWFGTAQVDQLITAHKFRMAYLRFVNIDHDTRKLFHPDDWRYYFDFFGNEGLDEMITILNDTAANFSPNDPSESRNGVQVLLAEHPEAAEDLTIATKFIHRLKDDYDYFYHFIIAAHGSQMYGPGVPYVEHLKDVQDVLKEYGYGPADSLLGLMLAPAALGHDSLEDTKITTTIIEHLTGAVVAQSIKGVSKSPKAEVPDRIQRRRESYIRATQELITTILKQADRISNFRKSLQNYKLDRENRLKTYAIDDWDLFMSTMEASRFANKAMLIEKYRLRQEALVILHRLDLWKEPPQWFFEP